MKILIVESEKQLAKSILQALRAEEYICELAHTAADATEKIIAYNYHCILLDINLPDANGLKILTTLKANNKGEGVIIITAKSSVDDKVHGLNLGADDYLAKPFAMPELVARLSALVRRKQLNGGSRINFHEISIDLPARTATVQNKKLDLTPTEFALLIFFVTNKNRIITKSEIAEHLSGNNTVQPDKLDVIYSHIKNLKKKLTKAGSEDYIKTVYGTGYKLSV